MIFLILTLFVSFGGVKVMVEIRFLHLKFVFLRG